MLQVLLLLVGFVVLVKGADFLVDGASVIAARLGISTFIIGLTVVAFGTSLPELFVNVFASVDGAEGIAIGNILGSNIANIFLILGVSAIIYPLGVMRDTVRKEIPFSLLVLLIFAVSVNDHWADGATRNMISRSDSLVMLAVFILFIYETFLCAPRNITRTELSENDGKSLLKPAFMVLLGLVMLYFGGRWIVNGAVFIARQFGVSENLIGLSVVAIGTSLPELATSAMAAYKHNVDIAVGNVVGSNVFNVLMVFGISGTLRPIPFDPMLNIDLAVAFLASLLLFVAMFTGRKRVVDRWEGIVFLLLYVSYVVFLIVRG